jgi:indolepyruvate decarboxylase
LIALELAQASDVESGVGDWDVSVLIAAACVSHEVEMTEKYDRGAVLLEQTVGEFLIRRLKEAGISHMFGVPGDYNLEFLEQVEADKGLVWVGCCNELNASYAADGYARTAGLAALMTTYGVGELSALCGIAGAYAEHLPVVAMSGAPPLAEIERNALVHHSAADGDFDNMMICAQQFSVVQARLTPQNAVAEVDRCLRACILRKRPVYLQLPSDVSCITIDVPSEPFSCDFQSDGLLLDAFMERVSAKLQSAALTVLLIDADVARFGLAEKIMSISVALKAPMASMGTAKGVIDETHPNYLGLYAGAYSQPGVQEMVETADCVLLFGVRFVDATTGGFSERIKRVHRINVRDWSGEIEGEDFHGISMADVVDRLSDGQDAEWKHDGALAAERAVPPVADRAAALRQDWFWKRMALFLEADDIVCAENGTSLSGLSGVRLPRGVTVLSQALWGSIGYSLPATFGSLIAAPERRHVLFIGDGSFQLTAQELSSILRHKLKPIIFLINNDGYTIERLILGEAASFNDVQPWRYAQLCAVFGDSADFDSRRVSTVSELEDALAATVASDKCHFIELMMERMDAPEALKMLGPVYARLDYGTSWVLKTGRRGR